MFYHLTKMFCFATLALVVSANSAISLESTWRGLTIADESRCAKYDRTSDYPYSQTVEKEIVKLLGNQIYSPYSGKFYGSTKETDIDHIVSLSEAHDSGLCRSDRATKVKFASDIRNLALASPEVNRFQKAGHDAANWLPEKNKCWYAKKVIDIKMAYNLSVDSNELISLEKALSDCSSFDMDIPIGQKVANRNVSHTQKVALFVQPAQANKSLVKKSKSGICHASSSSHFERVKNFTPYEDLASCIESGGRCPKRDTKCSALQASQGEDDKSHEQDSKNDHEEQIIDKNEGSKNSKNLGNEVVKKSKSGICHATSSSHFSRVKNFTSYKDLTSCIESGGRCPKKDTNCNNLNNKEEKKEMI